MLASGEEQHHYMLPLVSSPGGSLAPDAASGVLGGGPEGAGDLWVGLSGLYMHKEDGRKAVEEVQRWRRVLHTNVYT